MSDDPNAPPPLVTPPAPDTRDDSDKPIFLFSHPKIVFLYPTFIAAVVCGIISFFIGTEVIDVTALEGVKVVGAEGEKISELEVQKEPGAKEVKKLKYAATRAGEITTMVFMCVFSLNMIVLTFDFPRTTSLTLFFFATAVGMGLFLLFHYHPELFGVIGEVFNAMKPVANTSFFFMFAGILFGFYLLVLASLRFDYWEVRPNELLHRHGILSDLKRHPSPNIRIDKEINDVFEYFLLGSGRLIIHPTNEPRAIVLENVLFIDRKEQQLTKLLGALQVHLANDRNET